MIFTESQRDEFSDLLIIAENLMSSNITNMLLLLNQNSTLNWQPSIETDICNRILELKNQNTGMV